MRTAREHGTSAVKSRSCNESSSTHPTGSALERANVRNKLGVVSASNDNLAEFRAGKYNKSPSSNFNIKFKIPMEPKLKISTDSVCVLEDSLDRVTANIPWENNPDQEFVDYQLIDFKLLIK
ncbi:unnamed protein product [Hermetia illucens]|uniref:Uncharacterized protein n=1 Tax=Hermetia illucens TaxID=343691 RepID=A0A7R8UDD3_HERIL|nr:unnamed protein product [Hermetia illucens]